MMGKFNRRADGKPVRAQSKLTKKVQKQVVEALRGGNDYETAARYAGIHPRTHHRWMEKGEKARSGIYRQYYDAVTRARTSAVMHYVELVKKGAEGVPVKKTVTRSYVNREGDTVTETTVTEWIERQSKPEWWLEKMQRASFGELRKCETDANEAGAPPPPTPEEAAAEIMHAIRAMDEVTAGGDRKAD